MRDDPTQSRESPVSSDVSLLADDRDSDIFVRAVIAGEPWAEREMFRRYAPMVQATLWRCLGPMHDIDDLMQEVFLRVFDRVKTLRDFTALRSFVYTIAVRVARTDIRRVRIRRASEAVDMDDIANCEGISVDPEARDTLTHVQDILDGMKAQHRMAFVLRHVDGLSVGDVAVQLEVSVATVNRWLSRAAQHISREVDQDSRLVGALPEEGASGRALGPRPVSPPPATLVAPKPPWAPVA